MDTRDRLGELLISQHIISEEQLSQAVSRQKETGEKIGQVLISLGIVSEDQVLIARAQQLNIPFYDLKQQPVDASITEIIPESYARLYRLIALRQDSSGLVIGMSDPGDVVALSVVHKIIHEPISLVLVRDSDLERVFNLVYRRTKEIRDYAKELSREVGVNVSMTSDTSTQRLDAPVKKLLDSLFHDAAQMNASDIHIEPGKNSIRIRLRIDGVLHEQVLEDHGIMSAIVSRLKLLSKLNISEKRLPQDGHFEVNVSDKKYDVRLSTMPTSFGESIVMRLLKQSGEIISLESTGMPPELLNRYRNICKRSNGIILVTGPTGSGKSTTLYASLRDINKAEIKIITIEDPIEYRLPWAVQVQTNEQIGLEFSTVLRSILRHDPDIILIGEMRDKDTVSIAMRMALTGRLVFSTLHTNDALSTIYRLIDLGAEPYILSSILRAIVAQRLIRKNCGNCSQTMPLTQTEISWLNGLSFNTDHVEQKVGKGCHYCNHTGFEGRIAIFEILEIDNAMADALRDNDKILFHTLAKKSLHGKLLIDNAYQLVLEGKSSVMEMMRIVNESNINTQTN